jgi:hypothetical protein
MDIGGQPACAAALNPPRSFADITGEFAVTLAPAQLPARFPQLIDVRLQGLQVFGGALRGCGVSGATFGFFLCYLLLGDLPYLTHGF